MNAYDVGLDNIKVANLDCLLLNVRKDLPPQWMAPGNVVDKAIVPQLLIIKFPLEDLQSVVLLPTNIK